MKFKTGCVSDMERNNSDMERNKYELVVSRIDIAICN